MKLLTIISLAALLALGIGCSSNEVAAPDNSGALNYDVTGPDVAESVDAALLELQDLQINVPDPVANDDPALTSELDVETALAIVDRATLDEEGRVNFRRIVHHLYEQMRMLRRCMNENRDPRLRRLARGAYHATQAGLRALAADEPRMALRYFHAANRVLNLANRICQGEADGRGRP